MVSKLQDAAQKNVSFSRGQNKMVVMTTVLSSDTSKFSQFMDY